VELQPIYANKNRPGIRQQDQAWQQGRRLDPRWTTSGELLDALDELGIAGDTIVVWTSDNGFDTYYVCRPFIPIP
jgi:hypothetical protein